MTVFNAEESESDRRAKRFVLNSLGEEILKYLHDPNITEVYVNQDNMLRIESYSGRFNTEIKLTDDHIKRVCEAISGYNKEIIREDKPMLAVELSNLYLRAQLMYPPLTKKPTFFLRKKPERIFTLEEYIELGTISETYATYLLDAISKRKNILVVGGTGSGKTTFLKTVYRITKPDLGTIYLDGKPLDNISIRKSAQSMAVVAQFNNLNFDCSVLDVVMLGRTPHLKMMEQEKKEDYEIAYNALKSVGMYEKRNRSYLSLSGGEKQRVVLARAITQQPTLLLLDEPTNHLDIKYCKKFKCKCSGSFA